MSHYPNGSSTGNTNSLPAVQQPLVQCMDSASIISSQKRNGENKTIRSPNRRLPRTIAQLLTYVLLAGATWFAIMTLCQRLGITSKGIFMFPLMVFSSYLTGQYMYQWGLPQVIPMYVIGSAFKTYGLLADIENWVIFSNLRYLAITVILLKGGLSLDLKTMKTYPVQIIQSSFVICTVEALSISAAVYTLLPGYYGPLWICMFGFVMCATSPTKFSSTLAAMKATKQYTNDKLQSIWSFSSSIEDIYCISVFSVLLDITIRSRSETESAINFIGIGGAKLCCGIVAGTIWGILVGYLPHKDDINAGVKRFTTLWMGVICIYFGAKTYGWGPGGPIGNFIAGISANTLWSIRDPSNKKSVIKSVSNLWDWIMEPVLFCLVGYEIDVTDLPMSLQEVYTAVCCILIGALVRCLISTLVFYYSGFKWGEIVFLAAAGLPKATVQAAISPQVLDLLRDTEDHNKAESLVLAGILSTLIITTISTIFLHIFSTKLLKGPKHPVQVCP